MLNGTCHCSAISWTLDAQPKSVTACNCTICRRYGALWAYGFLGETIQTKGQTQVYRRRDSGDIDFHFCGACGCVTHYISVAIGDDGRQQAAVNTRMSDVSLISDVPIRHFEGRHSFATLPRDDRTVKDMWF